jgi:hypothetical protein
MYLPIKKSNFQYECVIKLQQHVLNEGSTRYKMRLSFLVPQLFFDSYIFKMNFKHLIWIEVNYELYIFNKLHPIIFFTLFGIK